MKKEEVKWYSNQDYQKSLPTNGSKPKRKTG